MIVTRHPETEQNPWSISNKLEAIYSKPTSPRMSNFDAPLSTQSDWQNQSHYSYLPPGESTIFSQQYDHHASSGGGNEASADPNAAAAGAGQQQHRPPGGTAHHAGPEIDAKSGPSPSSMRSPLRHHRSIDPLGLRQPRQPSPIPEQPALSGVSDPYRPKTEMSHDGSMVSATVQAVQPMPAQAAGHNDPMSSGRGHEETSGVKEDEDDAGDDEEMVEGDAETMPQPQTAAERTAQRRKMKRFRLTHQQTRFLMSEFSKQPHPDAAHRERLSREIPGLSPRQVQVWFQNRRAKIKRLTADDRDRMIKMRAVPDDFDNVQALHYGTVHGLGGHPMASPVDFGAGSYGHDMIGRPLMVDVRREGEEHISPTGLSPAFGGIGFMPSGTMSNPDMLSPMSPGTTDNRYGGYSSHHLSTPLSAGARSVSNPFASRGPVVDTSMQQMQGNHQRQQIRPLQPLQLRDTMARSRSESIQSPLRTSMSWKGDTIDYTTYPGGSTSPQQGARQGSVYGGDQMNSNTGGSMPYDSSSYSASSVQSPSHMSYPTMGSPSLPGAQQNRSRMRAASATLPLGLDLRAQYRPMGSGVTPPQAQPQPQHQPSTTAPRTPTVSHYGSSSATSYTSSYPPAPLTAPIYQPSHHHHQPGTASSHTTAAALRNPTGGAAGVPDYSLSQMSAPIAPPTDFSQASQSFQAGGSTGGGPARTPIRDSFGSVTGTGAGGVAPSPIGTAMSQQQPQAGAGDRQDDYAQDSSAMGGVAAGSSVSAGMKRKRSFSIPKSGTPVSTTPAQPYGNAV